MEVSMTRRCLLAGLVLCLLVTGSFAGTKVTHDEAVDFSKYETYAWTEGMAANNPKMQEYLEKRIDEQLAAKGLRKVVREQPDLHISTHAYSLTDLKYGSSYLYSPRYDVGVIAINSTDVTEGHLLIDLIDVETDKAVWQGVAEEKFSGREPAKIKRKIDKIVKKLFKSYPPA
jgi:hypothetical protein